MATFRVRIIRCENMRTIVVIGVCRQRQQKNGNAHKQHGKLLPVECVDSGHNVDCGHKGSGGVGQMHMLQLNALNVDTKVQKAT